RNRQVRRLHVSRQQRDEPQRTGALSRWGVHDSAPADNSALSGCHHGVRYPVSTLTVALVPEYSGSAGLISSSSRRTGTRCTTLTQLPVAFSGGSKAKSDPAPGLMLVTWALKT